MVTESMAFQWESLPSFYHYLLWFKNQLSSPTDGDHTTR